MARTVNEISGFPQKYTFIILYMRDKHRLPRDNKRDLQQQTQLKSTSGNMVSIPVWEHFATDQTDPWRVIPRKVFSIDFSSVCCPMFRWLSRGNRCEIEHGLSACTER